MSMWPEPVTLTGTYVTITPLSHSHHDDLVEATADGDLHQLWYTMVPSPSEVAAEIERRIALESMLARHRPQSQSPWNLCQWSQCG